MAVIGEVNFVDMLPKTRSGKTMRRVVVLGAEPGDITTIEDEASVEEAREAWQEMRASVEGPPSRDRHLNRRLLGSWRAGREHPLILRDGSSHEAAGGFLECGVFPRFPRHHGTPTFVRRQEFIPRHEVAVIAEHRTLPKREGFVLGHLRDHLGHDVGRDTGFL